MDQLLRDREAERSGSGQLPPPNISQEVDGEEKPKRKRKSEGSANGPRAKKAKPNDAASSLIPHKRTVKLTLGPKPAASEPFPCCLCVSMSKEKLLRVHDPPVGRRDIGIDELPGSSKGPKEWMAHEECANIVPETWVDFIEVGEPQQDEPRIKEQVVFGVDGIVKDRWNLVSQIERPLKVINVTLFHRNVRLALRHATGSMVPQFNALKANVQRHSTCPAPATELSRALFINCYKRWRKRSY